MVDTDSKDTAQTLLVSALIYSNDITDIIFGQGIG